MYWMHSGFGGMGIVGGLIGFLLFVLIVAAIVAGIMALLRHTRGPMGLRGPSAQAVTEDPLRILQQRYARGEITREQYLAMRDELKTES